MSNRSADIQRATSRVALRTQVAHGIAYDAVIEAIIRLENNAVRAERPNGLLATAASNLLYSAWRRPTEERLHGADVLVEDSREPEAPARAGDADEAKFLQKSVSAAIGRLPRTDQTVINDYYLLGKSLAAIDRENGSRVGNAKNRLHRARLRLRRLLEEDPGRLQRPMEAGHVDNTRGAGR